MCHITSMADQTTTMDRRTKMVPVTTMEEIPVLSERERAELTAALAAAAARAKAGIAVDYEPGTLRNRLVGICRRSKR
jgi:hypothetical protein